MIWFEGDLFSPDNWWVEFEFQRYNDESHPSSTKLCGSESRLRRTPRFGRSIKPFPTNQRFGLTASTLSIRIAKDSSATDVGYRNDGARLGQSKPMESPTHPAKNQLTIGGVSTSLGYL